MADSAKKLLHVLETRRPEEAWPARSNAILDRHRLLHKNRRRRTWTHPCGAVGHRAPEPGLAGGLQRPVPHRDGRCCYPLTITDRSSRAMLVCHGLRAVMTRDVKPVWRALFRAVGLPDAIRTDNGPPFASTGIHG